MYVQWNISQDKEKILPKTRMALEVMVLSEVSQAEKNKCYVTSHL